jgi:hypothetical protein
VHSAGKGALESFVENFQRDGFALLPNLFQESELSLLHGVLGRFHRAWCQANSQFYANKAINSAYLTDREFLSAEDRRALFRLLGDARLAPILDAVFPEPPAFLNTQLFFNPVNPNRKNYWHRDIQYTETPIAVQREQFNHINVIHLRLALMPEPGLEFVPGTHQRWDNDEQFAVRMAQNNRQVFDDLPNTKRVVMARGDLLIFSANMLHRGLYGAERFAFDMLFCDAVESILKYGRASCLPDHEDISIMENPTPFLRTLSVREQAGL